MREIIEKRTARSKTWDNEDGTFTLEIGGPIAHHHKNGQWLETDIVWRDLTTKWGTGEYPFTIDFEKQTRVLTMNYGAAGTITLQPTNSRNPTITKVDSTLNFAGLWRGVTLKAILTPDGVSFHFVKTATSYTNPTFNVTGPYENIYGPASYMDTTTGLSVTVPQSIVNGVLTFDLSAVPVGVEVE